MELIQPIVDALTYFAEDFALVAAAMVFCVVLPPIIVGVIDNLRGE